LSSSSFARSATALRQSRKLSFGLQPAVGNTRLQVLSDFAFHLQTIDQLRRNGISRSLYAFGVHPLSGLWLTRTVAWARLMSDQLVYMTSCSLISRHQEELVPEPLF